MYFINRIAEDFQRGENIDLYVTALAAISLTLINIFFSVPSSLLTSLNITILAFISITILGNRYRIEQLLEKQGTHAGILSTSFPSELDIELRNALEIMIVGVDLNDALKTNYALLLEKLKKGQAVKCILVDPESSACECAAKLHYEPISVNDKRLQIQRSLSICEQLHSESPENFELRLITHVPTFGGYLVNSSDSKTKLYIKQYRYRSPKGNVPVMIFDSHDGSWFNLFRDEMIEMWNNGESRDSRITFEID